MRWKKLRMAPEPSNVRAFMPDGTVIPIGLVYAGRENGLDIWEGVAPYEAADIRIGILPPRTTVRLVPGLVGPTWMDGDA